MQYRQANRLSDSYESLCGCTLKPHFNIVGIEMWLKYLKIVQICNHLV